MKEFFDREIKPLNDQLGKDLGVAVLDDDTVKVRTPSGTIIEMPRREHKSLTAIGVILPEVEDE